MFFLLFRFFLIFIEFVSYFFIITPFLNNFMKFLLIFFFSFFAKLVQKRYAIVGICNAENTVECKKVFDTYSANSIHVTKRYETVYQSNTKIKLSTKYSSRFFFFKISSLFVNFLKIHNLISITDFLVHFLIERNDSEKPFLPCKTTFLSKNQLQNISYN